MSESTSVYYDKIVESASYIASQTEQKPEIGIILGSGLGALVDIMENNNHF